MWPRWLRPRFSIRTLLLAVAVVAVGLWIFYTLPVYLPDRQDRLARAAIDPYELSIAGHGDPAQAPPELVTILGDSRLKHWAGVWDVAFVDNAILFSRGQDETIRFWDAKSGRQLRVLPSKVCTISGDGSKLFFVSHTKADVIEIWDAVKWQRDRAVDLKQGRPCVGLLASGDGSRFAAVFGEGPEEREVYVWEVQPSELVRKFEKVEWTRRSSRLDAAGKRLALYDGDLIHIWNVDTGQELGKAGPFTYETSKAVVYHCEFLDTAPNEVITADAAGRVVIWNYETGQEVTSLLKTPSTTSVLVVQPANIFVGDGSNVYNFTRWGQEWRMWEEVTSDAARRGGVSDMARRECMAFACNNHSIVLNPPLLSSEKWPDVTHLAFDPLGRFLATANRGGEISLWRMKTWKHIRTWPAQAGKLSQLLFTPDGSSLVSLGNVEATLWDPDTGVERRRITTGGSHTRQMAISPDGQLLASPAYVRDAPSTYAVRLWKIADGSIHQTIADRAAASRGQLAFVGAGDTLVMGGGKGMTVWDLANSKLLANLGNKTLHDVPLAVHPDGKRVAMQPWSGPIEVWDITTQTKLLSTSVHAGKAMVNSIAIHPGGKLAASAGEDGAACLWDFDTGAVVKSWQLGPPKGIVFQVAFSPDGRYLATVNGNGTAYILRLDGIIGANK
jgi:WD40 repeat protein